MSPKREIDETKGARPDPKVAEEAAEAKAEQAKPRRRRHKGADEETPGEPAKPRRRRRRRKADEDQVAAEPQAEPTEAAEGEEEPRAAAIEAAETEAPEAETDEEGPTPGARRPTPDEAVATEADADEDGPTPEARPARRGATPAEGPVSVRARARYVRTSARKARLICDHIRGKSVPEARAILDFTPRAAARDWSKVLESAVANAEANHELVGDQLQITEAYADEGPTLKRYRPRAMGRATRIRKRTSHLTITLAPAANETKERSR
jgi:ribosomal protein L22